MSLRAQKQRGRSPCVTKVTQYKTRTTVLANQEKQEVRHSFHHKMPKWKKKEAGLQQAPAVPYLNPQGDLEVNQGLPGKEAWAPN